MAATVALPVMTYREGLGAVLPAASTMVVRRLDGRAGGVRRRLPQRLDELARAYEWVSAFVEAPFRNPQLPIQGA